MDSVGPGTRELRVGEWWVRPLQNEVENGDECIHLEARSIDVLLCLAKNAPSVVSKETILDQVWGDVAVGDEVVSHAIWELRKSFGDDGRRQRYIRTIPKKGYALVAEVFWAVLGVEPQVGTAVGPYRLEEEIGRGAMGVVYRAIDMRLQRTVAIKFLAAELTRDAEAVRRFEREARLAASLDHPNLAPVFEVGEMSGGRQFLVTAYCGGGTLRDRLAESTLEPREALKVIAEVARGLAVAHQKNIVHRDVKPANILFTEDGTARLVDFGIAKLASSSSLTRSGHSLGTPAYKSPEQSLGGETDHRTDIWSLGVVLYECLTGRRPFSGSYEHAVVRSILEDEPDLSVTLPADRSLPGLEAILRKALAKNPEDRYQSAGELACVVEGCLGVSPVRRQLMSEPWYRRLRLGAFLIGSALLALWIVDWWSDLRADQQAQRAVRPILEEGWHLWLRGFKQEGTQRAREKFSDAYHVAPWIPEVRGSLAYSYSLLLNDDPVEKRRDLARVRSLLTAARSEGLEHGLLLVSEARLLLFEQKYSEAIAMARRAIDVLVGDPNQDLAYITLARAFELDGRDDEAFDAYQQSVRWGRGEVRGRENLAWFLWKKMGDEDGAASQYAAILKRDPDHVYALESLGMLLIDVGRHEDASVHLKRLVEQRGDARLTNALGVAYFYQSDKLDDACASFELATTLDPEYANAFNGLGDCFFLKGMLEDARKNWSIAVDLFADDHSREELNLHDRGLRAVVLAKLGRCEEALLDETSQLGAPIEIAETVLHRAQVHALCGEKADVYDLIREAADWNSPRRVFKADPCFAAFQGDPEFEAALEGK